ncbi:protein disabled isoform X2 [Tribolium castaneum]|uniref:protein disabled isoform X2 n=1 Tax=Tribolium castaneum TaxID=7070 RepID=UPI00046C2033|nr:PREDICTED: protein disabled isoform X2 [Tribolium castaneum]|eukprot:XP_008195099.1 PREDICTED: protein disabled isoform X2 [Tribolium castaneum]
MQTLRKKTSPLKYKNETTRFLGDGVSFKAKLIGILEVSEARGDRMCQEALSDLKMAIRAAGEHKQRITINIAIDGLRLRDEKTGDSLYHHPVHKISFIAQDMTDSRAFGYIFGSPDTGHRFFGIKTDKAASQVVIAMRDLFQVVFALKKKEIELAKQHLDKSRFTSSPLFSDSVSASKPVSQEIAKSAANDSKASNSEGKTSGTAVADLVDLELELNSLQQGLNQMERITPSDPFGSKDDPFGDSFTSYTKPILPPPPSSGRERSSRSSDSSSVFSPRTPHTATSLDASCDNSLIKSRDEKIKKDAFPHHDDDWFTQSTKSIFKEPPLVPEPTKDEKHEMTKQEILSQFDVFTELDPLGTGRSKPYIDKKHFFQELKNPPKKALNDLVSQSQQQEPTLFPKKPQKISNDFAPDPFGEDPFVTEDPFAEADPFETEFSSFKSKPLNDFDTLPVFQPATLSKSPKGPIDHQSNHDKFTRLHETASLDMSSGSECAPEPPPRPEATLMQIKPPPLPPKKQNDFSVKPPPRPPHADYDYMDEYETAPNSLEFIKTLDKSPPIPVPVRKTKFEPTFGIVPERPKKTFSVQSSEEDYLTPVAPEPKRTSPILLPPPQRSLKKQNMQVTVASYLETKPNLITSTAEGLDITLSQLTLSGLNELATKLNIPTNQLSNMTLVQLTNYLSNFIKSKNQASAVETNSNTTEVSTFNADFAANFNNLNSNTNESYDRYAVFRELMNEEIKQTKIDTEPEELKEKKATSVDTNVNTIYNKTVDNDAKDKYAALREIVESELKLSETKNENEQNLLNEEVSKDETVNNDDKFSEEGKVSPKFNLIEYSTVDKEEKVLKSPKSPVNKAKSPVPVAITEIMQSNARLNSGSLSDVVSGSSPEVDNTGSNSEMGKKPEDAAGESWAIFDQGNVPPESVKEKQAVQSEEGVSPWSSDSKEFGNNSPPDWRRGDSESGGDRWTKRRGRRDQEGWWDTSAEPEVQYYPSNRRSTDSYEDEYYECYEKPRRRKQTVYVHGGSQGAGGHSSSSRDVSPWEEEPRRRDQRAGWVKHARQHSFEKHRDRRHTDSWDDEDDYEYEDEHVPRFHRQKWEIERERYNAPPNREHDLDKWESQWSEDRRHRRRREGERDRWCCPDWDVGEHEKPVNRYGSNRWTNMDGPPGMWRERKHDERYYSRESQESPWEDEYSNEAEEVSSSHYLTARRNWKRPSSASEMDRKTGEIKSRHYFGAGGSDGERDRRYKPGRRSRSRDSQYSESSHRHKPEGGPTLRGSHRSKQYAKQFEADFAEMPPKKQVDSTKSDHSSNKKSATLASRKKKESPKAEVNIVSTFPRKSTSRAKSLFENDFVPSEDSPVSGRADAKFSFENDFETSEAESPTVVNKPLKGLRQQSMFEKTDNEFSKESFRQRSLKELKLSPRTHPKQKSLFEDDFSPSGKPDPLPEDSGISSIKEEADPNDKESSFSTNNATNSRKKKLNKNRLSNNFQSDINIKKSESVNIFARESDPFDDDFFSENVASHDGHHHSETSPKTTDLKWTDDFEDFDIEEKN